MHELKLESTIFTCNFEELSAAQKALVDASREALSLSHAPYSKFNVGCAIRLGDQTIVRGANQENAAYPICLCAEGATLAAVSTQFPKQKISEVAIFVPRSNPASPCGLCRQSFKEYETRMKQPIRLILSGMNGKVIVVEKAGQLLPLSFGGEDLK